MTNSFRCVIYGEAAITSYAPARSRNVRGFRDRSIVAKRLLSSLQHLKRSSIITSVMMEVNGLIDVSLDHTSGTFVFHLALESIGLKLLQSTFLSILFLIKILFNKNSWRIWRKDDSFKNLETINLIGKFNLNFINFVVFYSWLQFTLIKFLKELMQSKLINCHTELLNLL